MFSSKEEGFTLVELLIVIAIIGILAMVAVPKFMNMQKDAGIKACKANQGTLETAVEQYASQQTDGSIPAAGDQGALVDAGILKRQVFCPSNTTNHTADAESTDYTWTVADAEGKGGGVVTCNNTTGIAAGHNGE